MVGSAPYFAANTFYSQYIITAPTKASAMKIRSAIEVLVSGLGYS
jgi:hypothetical protein